MNKCIIFNTIHNMPTIPLFILIRHSPMISLCIIPQIKLLADEAVHILFSKLNKALRFSTSNTSIPDATSVDEVPQDFCQFHNFRGPFYQLNCTQSLLKNNFVHNFNKISLNKCNMLHSHLWR